MNKFNVYVTGATGMVGYHVVKHMLALGHKVIAFVRQTSNVRLLQDIAGKSDLAIKLGDLANREYLAQTMAGAQVVIHCAGIVNPYGTKSEIYAVNVGGTEAVLRAAIAANVTQFIHISSLSVITAQHDQFKVSEEAPLVYCGEAYADSKIDAEKLVLGIAHKEAINVTILRPGFIYGPRERAWMPKLIEALRSGKVVFIDGGAKETNVIYVGNLVKAVELSLLNKRSYSQTYNLTDGEVITKKKLFDTICEGLGYPRITRSVPWWVARGLSEIVSFFAPYLPSTVQPKLTRFSRAAFRLAGVNQGFDINKAKHELGYTEPLSFGEGMSYTLAYFRQHQELQ